MIYDICTYGAKPDVMEYRRNAAAIQNAIDTAAEQGGGQVLIPEGTFYSGNIFLKSNVTLWLSKGAKLVASPQFEDYLFSTQNSPWAPMPGIPLLAAETLVAFINAEYAENVSICGEGEIDGQGMNRRYFPATNDPQHRRPHLILFHHCKSVTISGISMRNPAFFTCYIVMSKDVAIENIRIWSLQTENGDGIDFDGVKNASVTGCTIASGDDAISLKTTDPEWPCDNVQIWNCQFQSLWGGVRIGTESSADMKNVTVENCVFWRCNDAVKIQDCSTGLVENVHVRNCIMQDVHRPIFITLSRFRLSKKDSSIRPHLGGIRNIKFSGLTVHVSEQGVQSERNCVVISGCPEKKLEEISLQDVHIFFHENGHTEGTGQIYIPEYLDYSFLYADIFSVNGYYPSFGPFVRHINGLNFERCGFYQMGSDTRPAMYGYDVHNSTFSDVFVSGNAEHFMVGTDLKIKMQMCKWGDQEIHTATELTDMQQTEYIRLREESAQVDLQFNDYAAVIDKAQAMPHSHLIEQEKWLKGEAVWQTEQVLPVCEQCILTIPLYGSVSLYCNGMLAGICKLPQGYRGLILWPCDVTGLIHNGKNVFKLVWDDPNDRGGIACILPFGQFYAFDCGVHGVTSVCYKEKADA